MAQQSLIYSFVSRGTVVLAEYTEFTGNFTSIASQCLQKLPASNNKFTYNCDGHTFNFLVADGFTYCVVAVESAGRQLPMAFLERVKEEFSKRYGGGKAEAAPLKSLNKEFGPKLKEHMQYCVDHPEEVNKLAKVQAQVSEVKGVMMENIEKVLDRGEKIELLVDKTDNLRSQDYGLACSVKQTTQETTDGCSAVSPRGSRVPITGNTNEEENVVSEHEDKADCIGHYNRIDSYHHFVSLPWIQLWEEELGLGSLSTGCFFVLGQYT